MAYVAIYDRDDEHALHDPTTFVTKYIWSQDHKVIAIQYGLTAIFVGLVALVLSGLMRIQMQKICPTMVLMQTVMVWTTLIRMEMVLCPICMRGLKHCLQDWMLSKPTQKNWN